jgi:hypothetical protein
MLKKSGECLTLHHSGNMQMLHGSIVVAGYCATAEKRYLELNKGRNETKRSSKRRCPKGCEYARNGTGKPLGHPRSWRRFKCVALQGNTAG